MKSLKISITGVRGIVGDTLTPELIINFSQAFGTYLDSGRVLVCRDTRPSGTMIRSAVLAGLIATGCEVIDLGVCPTPSMQLMIKKLGARGGISISAGHNPQEWNALKFVRDDGVYLNSLQGEELLDIFHQGEFTKAPWNGLHSVVENGHAIDNHIEVLKRNFNAEAISSRQLSIALDCCNGACSYLTPRLLEELGCRVVAINNNPQEQFPHDPNPTPRNMNQVAALVRASNAEIGFAHDADGERLGIVTKNGDPLSEEMTLAISTQIQLERMVGAVVTNLSTTRSIDDIAEAYGAPVVRTPIGQPYISEAVIEHGAVIGGEGSGGVTLPKIQFSHDSAAAMLNILEYLATSGETISQLASRIPAYSMVKRNLQLPPNIIFASLQRMRAYAEKRLKRTTVDFTDGIKISWKDRWVHVRASNTESMIRIIAEAKDQAKAHELVDWAQYHLRKAL